MNGGVVFGVGHIAIEESLGGARIHKFARDGDDALVIVDGYGAGLQYGLAGKIALGGHQRPGAVHGAVVRRDGGASEKQGRQDGCGDGGRICPHDYLSGLLFSTEAGPRNTACAARFEWPAFPANSMSWSMASISRGPSGSQPRTLYCLRPF